MDRSRAYLKHIVTAFAAILVFSTHAALAEDLDTLFAQLRDPEEQNWEQIEDKIWAEWSNSGSDAMDVLLKRGESALENSDIRGAIEHFSALIDHAPDFAEGYNGRAKAYYEDGQFGPALSDIAKVLALNPRHFGAMTGLAAILEQMEYPEDALKAYREVLAIHPHRPDVLDAVKRLEVATRGTDL